MLKKDVDDLERLKEQMDLKNVEHLGDADIDNAVFSLDIIVDINRRPPSPGSDLTWRLHLLDAMDDMHRVDRDAYDPEDKQMIAGWMKKLMRFADNYKATSARGRT